VKSPQHRVRRFHTAKPHLNFDDKPSEIG